jgi:hypothetical protein
MGFLVPLELFTPPAGRGSLVPGSHLTRCQEKNVMLKSPQVAPPNRPKALRKT